MSGNGSNKADGDVSDDPDKVGIGEQASTQSNNGLKLIMTFTSLKDLKIAVNNYTIHLKKQITWAKNEGDRATTKCVEAGCNWEIYFSRVGKHDIFKIKTLTHVHNCRIVATKNNQANKEWIISILKEHIKV
jgi:hypothetical protein